MSVSTVYETREMRVSLERMHGLLLGNMYFLIHLSSICLIWVEMLKRK